MRTFDDRDKPVELLRLPGHVLRLRNTKNVVLSPEQRARARSVQVRTVAEIAVATIVLIAIGVGFRNTKAGLEFAVVLAGAMA